MKRTSFLLGCMVFFCSISNAQTSTTSKEPTLCELVKEFSVATGSAPRTIKFSAHINQNGSRAKECSWSQNDMNANRFCTYLSEHLSAEFMPQNLSRIMSCLAKQTKITGEGIDVKALAGKIAFYEPYEDRENIIVELEFKLTSEADNTNDFISLTSRSGG